MNSNFQLGLAFKEYLKEVVKKGLLIAYTVHFTTVYCVMKSARFMSVAPLFLGLQS